VPAAYSDSSQISLSCHDDYHQGHSIKIKEKTIQQKLNLKATISFIINKINFK
jgi:hypothetical protein